MRVFYGCTLPRGDKAVVVLDVGLAQGLTSVLGWQSELAGLWGWGDHSVGAFRLAGAILTVCIGDPKVAGDYANAFVRDIVSHFESEAFGITEGQVNGWLAMTIAGYRPQRVQFCREVES